MEGGLIPPAAGKVPGRLHSSGNYTSVPGVSGMALQFGALPTGVTVSGLKFDFTRPFTAIATVRLAPEAAKGPGYRVFKDIFANTGTRGPGVRLTVFYGGIQFNSGNGTKADSVITRPAEYAVPIDRWFQIAVVYDGEKVTLYADGAPIASKALVVTPSGNPLCIGANRTSAYPFLGAIDDFALYDSALPPEAIAALALNAAE
jgi:hypothetical protein